MNAFVNKFLTFERATIHTLAVALVVVAGWWVTHPEQVAMIVKAYPKATIIGSFATLIMALYTQARPGNPSPE